MGRKRKLPDGMYYLSEVAEMVGMSPRQLTRKLLAGLIPEPGRHPTSRYRMWNQAEVLELRRIRDQGLDDGRRRVVEQ